MIERGDPVIIIINARVVERERGCDVKSKTPGLIG